MTQAKSKPDRERISPIHEVYKLVGQCSSEDLEELVEEVNKLLRLRHKVAEAEASVARGDLLDGEQVFAELIAELESRKAAQ